MPLSLIGLTTNWLNGSYLFYPLYCRALPTKRGFVLD